VKSGDILAEVETDKATMELESFFDGTLLNNLSSWARRCRLADRFAPSANLGKSRHTRRPQPADKPAATATAPVPPPNLSPPRPQRSCSRRRFHRRRRRSNRPWHLRRFTSQPQRPLRPRRLFAFGIPLLLESSPPKKASIFAPAGHRSGGRIVQSDILAAAATPAAAPSAPPAPWWALIRSSPRVRSRTMNSCRSPICARRLRDGWSSQDADPHFYLEVEIDAEPLLALRAQLNSGIEKDGVKLSINDLILRASADALRAVPAVNCSWEVDAAGQAAIRRHSAAHVAFAVAIDDGLITPVIRDTHRKTVVQISIEARELAALAKARSSNPSNTPAARFAFPISE